MILVDDERVPFETLSAVLYTVMQADLSKYHFLVETPQGDTAGLRYQPPRLSTCAPPPIPPETPYCAVPDIIQSDEGTFVAIMAIQEVGGCGSSWIIRPNFNEVGSTADGADDEVPGWNKGVLVPNSHTCPSAPGKNGAYEPGEVKKLLERFDEVEFCSAASLTAAEGQHTKITTRDWLRMVAELQTIEKIGRVLPSFIFRETAGLHGCPNPIVVD